MNEVLFCDLYELTMAQQYISMGVADRRASFEVFVRKFPADRKAMVMAGLGEVMDMVGNGRMTCEDIFYLRGLGIPFPVPLEWIKNKPLFHDIEIEAIPEGTLFFENEPILRVTGPMVKAQLLETYILNALGFAISVATKASRMVVAAEGRTLSDFSPRRCQGIDAAMKTAKYSHLAGFASTSNVEAAKQYGIPVTGTVAHSFITSCEDEREAFTRLLNGGVSTILLDTYDTKKAIQKLIVLNVAALRAVRIDSGDIDELSRYVRGVLDQNGLNYVKTIVSGDMDEYKIAKLVADKAPIDVFGVGTALGTCNDAPALGITYKLVDFCCEERMKFSEGKATLPGRKQIYRNKKTDTDTLGLMSETHLDFQYGGLLQPVSHGYRTISFERGMEDKEYADKLMGIREQKVVPSSGLISLTEMCEARIKRRNGL